jgi:hypothetical protein
VENLKEVALVKLYPKTGRTHQLRVHCAAIGHPIVGDQTYGARAKWAQERGITRPLLHAEKLDLEHPVTGKSISFTAPLPKDMKQALALFRRTAKATAVLGVLLGGLSQGLPAEETGHKKSTKAAATTAHTPSGAETGSSRTLSRQMSSLRAQFKVLIEEVSALEDRVTGIQKNLDELDTSRRLRDLEKAISDLNGKAAGTSAVTEETRTQLLDLSRKIKAQQEAIELLRDQMDRVQREMIQAKSRDEESPVPAVKTP